MEERKPLTKRQLEFLAMTARGMGYEAIANKCVISIETVRKTFSEARKRSDTSTTAQCIIVAIAKEELGLTHDGICFIPKEF